MKKNKGKLITRRVFLSILLAGGLWLLHVFTRRHSSELSDFNPFKNKERKQSRTVVVKVIGTTAREGKDIRFAGGLPELINRSVMALTGKDSVSRAFRALFSPKDKVAIKVPGPLNDVILITIMKGLLEAGVKVDNIEAYDFVYGQEVGHLKRRLEDELGIRVASNAFSSTEIKIEGVGVKLAQAVCRCDALINLASLNTHLNMEYTGALKNHMGSIDKPHLLHVSFERNLGLLNSIPQIRNKTRLVVLDALRPSLRGHPDFPDERYFVNSGTIFMSRDPLFTK